MNLIDLENLALRPPEIAFDLPGGAKRLVQRSVGYQATVVIGEVTYSDGEPTGAFPGRVIRGGRSAA